MENTHISWADHTFNPWIGCTKVSAGCDHCYAERLAESRLGVAWGRGAARRRTAVSTWRRPLAWNRRAQREQKRFRIFCASLADVFDAEAPAGALGDLWSLIADTPHLDWMLLTKRPQRIQSSLPPFWADIRQHVWLGISAEDQRTFDERWPVLEAVDPAVRFVSAEPMLGGIQLPMRPPWPDWMIVGGESGPGARPLPTDAADALFWACDSRRIPFWFKQHGGTDRDKGGDLFIDGAPWQELPRVC